MKTLLFLTLSYKWIWNYLTFKDETAEATQTKEPFVAHYIFMFVYVICTWTRVYLWGLIEQDCGSFSSSHLDLHQLSCQLALHLSAAEMLAWLSPHIF